MLIDWFTVGAQALNFLVLVWLMKRYLYKPVLDAIDARERRVAKELADAGREKDDAQKERDALTREHEELDAERATLRTRAMEEVAAERTRMMNEARVTAELAAEKRRSALDRELQDLRRALVRRTQDEVFAIARRALSDLSTASLEERASEVFTRRLRELPADARARVGEALGSSSRPALVRSAFDLPEAQRADIRKAIREVAPGPVELRFEVAPDLVCGVELVANGQKVAWTIADYLASLEESVVELVKASSTEAASGASDQPPTAEP
jgi:F-type H+-transporting ATPase subunit b